jgi:hypothetical protein
LSIKEAFMDIQYEIEKKAYELFEKNGRICGCEIDHWLEAEKIVCARLLPAPVAQKPAVKKTAPVKSTVRKAKTKAPAQVSKSKTAVSVKNIVKKPTAAKRGKRSDGKEASL